MKDVARSKAFYSDVLGFEELWYVKHENTGSQLQFMQQKGVILELVQKGSGQKQRDGVDGTINHLCMQVQDIEAAKAALEVAGVVFENEIQLDPDLYPKMCIRDRSYPYGLPELIGVLATAGLHLYKRNTLLSIAGGTAVYMLMVQCVFV